MKGNVYVMMAFFLYSMLLEMPFVVVVVVVSFHHIPPPIVPLHGQGRCSKHRLPACSVFAV